VGRNIHQRSLQQATALTKALSALIYQKVPLEEAMKMVNQPS
jgi:DhnA family fructose-bisphosphate aldolase class Ia